MKCPSCGYETREGATRCAECWRELSWSEDRKEVERETRQALSERNRQRIALLGLAALVLLGSVGYVGIVIPHYEKQERDERQLEEREAARKEAKGRQLAQSARDLASRGKWKDALDALNAARELIRLSDTDQEVRRAALMMEGVRFMCSGDIDHLLLFEPQIPRALPPELTGEDAVLAKRLLDFLPAMKTFSKLQEKVDQGRKEYREGRDAADTENIDCSERMELYRKTLTGVINIRSWIDPADYPKAPPNAYLASMPSGARFVLVVPPDQAFVTTGLARVTIAPLAGGAGSIDAEFENLPMYAEWTSTGLEAEHKCEQYQRDVKDAEAEVTQGERNVRTAYERMREGLRSRCDIGMGDQDTTTKPVDER